MDFPINQHKAHMKAGVDIRTQSVAPWHWSITCPTGALSREETLPPMAGAALHPGPDDPGHVHPHVTFTGQLPQHQAVHLAMRAGRRDALIPLHRSGLRHSGMRCGGGGGVGVCVGGVRVETSGGPFADLDGNGLRSGTKDAAEAAKWEVSGSIGDCDQAEIGSLWHWGVGG